MVFEDFTPQGVCDFLKKYLGVHVTPCPHFNDEREKYVNILYHDNPCYCSRDFDRIWNLAKKLGFYIESNGWQRIAVWQKKPKGK